MLSEVEKQQKLELLAGIEGYADARALIMENALDSVVPGICTAAGCDYSTWVEPDCREGWCEACGTSSVASCLVLQDII